MCNAILALKRGRIISCLIYFIISVLVTVLLESFSFNWYLVGFSIAVLLICVCDALITTIVKIYNTKWVIIVFIYVGIEIILLLSIITTAVKFYWDKFPQKRILMELFCGSFLFSDLVYIFFIVKHIRAAKGQQGNLGTSLVTV